MVAVLVHGVPETPAVWGPLTSSLTRNDILTPQLPGFGCALPDGFSPTKERYAAWLESELSGIDEPIDLVGHDWGAMITLRVVADGRLPIRSWVTDGADVSADFEWHDLAKAWQTPGAGEEMMAAVVGASDEERRAINESSGIPDSASSTFADAFDQTMADSILSLYRSAVDVGAQWGGALDAVSVPTLMIEALGDPFRREGAVRSGAERLGAEIATLDAGHWWMTEIPEQAAVVLEQFWERVAAT
ncbi:MAG: alpha/beta hydrolase [Actinomycetota bacterium]